MALDYQTEMRTAYRLCKKSDDPQERRAELVRHLALALKLEHATIPPYLCALYSIKDPDKQNYESARVLRSVVIEEMLHMILVANLLNAIQSDKRGKIQGLEVDDSEFIPRYPSPLPGSAEEFEVSLGRFAPNAIELFLRIEKPAEVDAEPAHDQYPSIGQFYKAIKQEFDDFRKDFKDCDSKKLFIGDPDRQIPWFYYYNGGGEIIAVTDYESAHRAIKVIVDEGEGFSQTIFSGDHEEFGEVRDLAHYYKFNQIYTGRYYRETDSPQEAPTGEPFPRVFRDDAVYPVDFAADLSDYPEILAKQKDANVTYWDLLRACKKSFNGEPEHLKDAVRIMYDVKEKMRSLMRIPIGDTGTTAGPTFRSVPKRRKNC